jgi:hypothetical protein
MRPVHLGRLHKPNMYPLFEVVSRARIALGLEILMGGKGQRVAFFRILHRVEYGIHRLRKGQVVEDMGGDLRGRGLRRRERE